MNTYHIVNGDALKEQFPSDKILGEIIVARECMVDGPVNEKNLKSLFQQRAEFIKEAYGENNYHEYVTPELRKISDIESGEVNLWFEEDLFCQINLWFVCSLLYLQDIKVYIVIPEDSLEFGFGGLNKDELAYTYQNRKPLTKINVNQFALLWFAYRSDDIERLLKLGVQVHEDFPFVMRAIGAHFDRMPKDNQPGKPEQIIREIMKEKSTEDFGAIFREFQRRAPIYGYGDLQVKRIFDRVIHGKI